MVTVKRNSLSNERGGTMKITATHYKVLENGIKEKHTGESFFDNMKNNS